MKQRHLQFGGREEEPSRCHVTKMEHGGSDVPGSARVPSPPRAGMLPGVNDGR